MGRWYRDTSCSLSSNSRLHRLDVTTRASQVSALSHQGLCTARGPQAGGRGRNIRSFEGPAGACRAPLLRVLQMSVDLTENIVEPWSRKADFPTKEGFEPLDIFDMPNKLACLNILLLEDAGSEA